MTNINHSNIEKLPGVQVDDITDLVEWFIEHLSVDPITCQQYTSDQIVTLMCKLPDTTWIKTEHSRLYMECCLLRETISDLRLDAIQHTNSIREIASICRDAGL